MIGGIWKVNNIKQEKLHTSKESLKKILGRMSK